MHNTLPSNTAKNDPRWQALSLIQIAKESFSLKDRDITVLRGLMTLIPQDAWEMGKPIVVFASNRVLAERCDGIEERTLRRRLAKLCESGLVQRNMSPNRKRYTLRDENHAIVACYGFDLSPIRNAIAEIRKAANAAAKEARQIKLLKSILRDHLWHIMQNTPDIDVSDYKALLRRKVTRTALQEAIQTLQDYLVSKHVTVTPHENMPEKLILTDSDGKNDRHIHNSNKEQYEKKDRSISLTECIEKTPIAQEYSYEKISQWSHLAHMVNILGPGIEISSQLIQKSRNEIGDENTSLMIMGIIQANNRIQQPARYFQKLLSQAKLGKLNVVNAFASLTRKSHGFRPETTVLN